MTDYPRFLRLLSFGICFVFGTTLVPVVGAFDFGVDPDSPEVPARTPSDIYEPSGANMTISAAQLGLNPNENIDAMSYGHDEIIPLGLFNKVVIDYSVDRGTRGAMPDGRPGGGLVRGQTSFPGSNGAAGDKFYITAVGNRIIGLIPIARGLRSDAPMHNLTPLPEPQSDLDQMSGPFTNRQQPVYFSVDASTAQGRPGWEVGDIISVTPGPNPTPTVWARGVTDLGLQPGEDIDALALRNRGNPEFGGDDIVWISLVGQPTLLQVRPAPHREILSADDLTLRIDDELNAVTGTDPGPDSGCFIDDETGVQLDEDALVAAVEVLTGSVILQPIEGPLSEVVAVLEEHAGREFRVMWETEFPDTSVKLDGEEQILGAALQSAVEQVGWTYELNPAGEILIGPCEPPPPPLPDWRSGCIMAIAAGVGAALTALLRALE